MFVKHLILALLSSIAMRFLCAGENMGIPIERTLDGLESQLVSDRETAVKELLQLRNKAIARCEDIIRSYVAENDRKGTVASAVSLLGDLRSESSVPLLVENITFEVFYKDTKRPQAFEDRYPCVQALGKIGFFSIEPVLKKTTGQNDDLSISCGAVVCRIVLGKAAGVYLDWRI